MDHLWKQSCKTALLENGHGYDGTTSTTFAYQCLFSNLARPDERCVNCAGACGGYLRITGHLQIVVLKVSKQKLWLVREWKWS